MKNHNKIKNRILIPVAVAIYILVAIFYIITTQLMNFNVKKDADRQFSAISQVLSLKRAKDVKIFKDRIFTIQNDKEIQKYWLAKDRNQLLKRANVFYKRIGASFNITHFYFHDTNSINFLRVHKPDKYGDFIDRTTMKLSKESDIISSGLDVGPLGTFTLRVVVPWYINGKLEGYVELGEEIEHQMKDIHKTFKLDLFVLLKKEYTSELQYKLGMKQLKRDANWDAYNKYVLIYKSKNEVSENIEEIAVNKEIRQIIFLDREFMAISIDLQDVNFDVIASVVLLSDVTESIHSKENAIFVIFTVSFLIGSILLLFIYFILQRIEKNLVKSEEKAISEEKLRNLEQEKHIQELRKEEAKIKGSEERFQQVANYSNSIIWEINNEKEYTYINSVVEKILGYTPKELIGNNGYMHFPNCKENDISLVKQKALLELKGKYSDLEFKLKTKDGKIIWVASSGANMLDSNGVLIGRRGISTDITERKKNEEAIIRAKIVIEKAEEKTRSILEAIPDMLFIFDKDGVFLDYHTGSDSKLTLPPELFLGKNIAEVFPPNIAELTKKSIIETISNKTMNVFRYSIPFEDKVLNEEARMVPYGKNKVLTMVRDITDVLEAENKLIEAKEKAEKADKLKTTFLAQMSHEIRTPINSIVSLSSIVEQELIEYADDDLETCFNLIQKSGARIVRTTDLILNLSEIEAGTYEIIKEDFNLVDGVLNKLINHYLPFANEKNIELKLENNLTNPIISADSYTIEQIFSNLIDNSIKYIDNEGSVIIKVFENKENKKVVEVIDTGVGISEEYLSKLFIPFSQEMMGYTRKYEGNGVGLALAKEYCKLNDAIIEVESVKGEGSTFRVIFE